MDNYVFVFGVGNYTEVIIELIHDVGLGIKGLFHFNNEKTGKRIMGYNVLGDYSKFLKEYNDENIVVAIGDNNIRVEVFELLLKNTKNKAISLIHPKAEISKSAKISKKGVYIHSNTFVWTKACVDSYTIISPNAMVSHHAKIKQGCLISANAMVGSYVTINDQVLVGINSGIISKSIQIGKYSIIGGQSFITKDIPEREVWAGVPAKKIKNL